MKKIPKSGILIAALTLLIIALNLLFQVPQGEGFNPSDDGVILAQGYRIINGEIPHVDFISIRPVGSAVFHSLSFALPFPLEIAARWICLLEYMVISLLWSWLLFRTIPRQRQKPYIFLVISALVFVLNQNFYNLFPWTTIDAIFFFSIGFSVYWYWRKRELSPLYLGLWYFVTFFFLAYSALCRQTFALPVLILGILILVESIQKKRFISFLIGGLAGLWPYAIYFAKLLKERALGDFYDQLTGRTEIWETGFEQFGQQFWSSPFLVVYIIIMVFFLFYKLGVSEESGKNTMVKFRRLSGWILLALLSGIIVLIYTDTSHLFNYSFVLFWLYLSLLISGSMFSNSGWRDSSLHWWIMGIAWISSLSLGDNSPVFTTGLLAGGLLVLIIQQLYNVYHSLKYSSSLNWMLVILSTALLGVSIYAQKENNYRDLRAGNLNFQMNSFLPDMGEIRTNSRTYSYMQEISELYNDLDSTKGRFVVLPNATLIYPLLDSENPMPLDWMQGPEFVGQEDELLNRLETLDKHQGIYLLFDRYNSKLLADSLVEMDYNSGQYSYYDYLIENSTAIGEIESEWFDVRFWK